MDLNIMTAIMAPASAELPDARSSLKGEDPAVLPFEIALLTELQLLTPACELPVDISTQTGEAADLLDALPASDSAKGGLPDMQLPMLATVDPVAQTPLPTAPQLTVPPFVPPPAPPAEQMAPLATPAAPSAAVASATLVPMAAAQLRAAEPASTGPIERPIEKAAPRFTGAATLPHTASAMEPGDKVLAPPSGPLTAAVETPPEIDVPAVRPRMPERAPESAIDKPQMRAETAPQVHTSAPAVEVQRAPVRLEAPIAAEVARAELPVSSTSAPTASITASPAPNFVMTQATQYTAAQPPATVTAHIQIPFGQTEWTNQLREKVVWLVDRQQQSAEIHIHPPHLGPVEVMLTLNDDRTSIAFISPHPAVREAIEASFSDLRTNLEERGLALGHASVNADPKEAREQLPQDAQQSGRRFAGGMAGGAAESHVSRTLVQRGLVDTFA
jgi:flagellar hook-length control protein FliK